MSPQEGFRPLRSISWHLLLSFVAFCALALPSGQSGTWTPLARTAPGSIGLMLLLPDGTVMAANSNTSSTWYRLTPDSQGHYINGTWNTLQAMHDTRLYYSSQVLKDGRVFVAGGEYGTGKKTGEVYNPLTNTWKMAPPSGHTFSDSNSEILPDGRILVALVEGALKSTLLFDPVANTWTNGPTSSGIHNESAWVKLPDDSFIMVDRLATTSERYIPSLNQWVADATVPVSLYDAFGDETGGAVLLPNGKAFFLGSTGHTALYTPSGTNSPGTWAAGPDVPGSQGAPDAPMAILPNGKVVCAVSPSPTSTNHFPSPTAFYEYDYVANSFTAISTPSGSTLNHPSYFGTMLVLPDGTMLYSDFNSRIYSYQFDGSPVAAGKPTISAITQNADASFHLTGTLLNGISEGSSYGDDNQNNTNYPIVRLASAGGAVTYARSYNWSSTGVSTGATVHSTEFVPPAGLAAGTYSVVVIANGIASDAVSLDLAPITVSLAASATEGAASLAGTVTLPTAPAADTTVTLTSSLTTRATVPATITVLAGQTSATFSLTVIDDALLNGSDAVTISAAADGYQGGSSIIAIRDNEAATLSVTPSTTLSATGPYGGPFPTTSVTYTLTNTGNTSLSWTAAKAASWITLVGTSGTLAAGATTTVTASIGTGANSISASTTTYTDTVIFNNTTNGDGNAGRAASLTVNKSSPVFSNLTASPTITYGTASVVLSGKIATAGNTVPSGQTISITVNGTTLTPTVAGTGTFSATLNTSTLPASATPYTITYSYAGNTNFNATSDATTTLTVNKASPTFSNLTASPTVLYGTSSVSFSGNLSVGILFIPGGETVSVSVNGVSAPASLLPNGTFTTSIDSHALPASTYTVTISYAGDTNFSSASDSSLTLTVLKRSPSFAGLTSSPSVPFGTSSVTLSGAISPAFAPPTSETVSILVNGVTLTPAIAVGGLFSATLDPQTFAPGTYTITYSYAGDANFNAATDTSTTLTITGFPVLAVSGPALTYSGTPGGPVTPTNLTLTIANTGAVPLPWTVSKTADWLTLSTSGGTIAPGATASLVVTADSSALTLGNYTDTLTFTNTTNGLGNATRAVTLAVLPPAPVLATLPPFTKGTSESLSWSAIAGADSYEAEVSTTPDFTSVLSSQSVATPSATFTNLGDGTLYYYRVRTISGAFTSLWSGVVSSAEDASAPVVALLSPTTSGTTTHHSITLTGTATDSAAGVASVTVNGQSVTTTDAFAHWSASVTLTDGTANTITIAATDLAQTGGNSTTSTLTIQQQASTQNDGIPDSWKIANGIDPSSVDPAHGPIGDLDHDGRSNLLEYALNSDPNTSSPTPSPFTLQTDSGTGLRYFTFTYQRRIGLLDLTYAVETSTDASTWSSAANLFQETGTTPNGDGVTETVTIRLLPAVSATSTKFARLRVTLN